VLIKHELQKVPVKARGRGIPFLCNLVGKKACDSSHFRDVQSKTCALYFLPTWTQIIKSAPFVTKKQTVARFLVKKMLK
jgi:hypothetical protein